jgi:integrase
LKTQKKRTFPCNSKLKEFLISIKPENCNPDDLIFPAPYGGLIDVGRFRNRIWEPLITAMGIEYRKPYQTRHTFVTLALESGHTVQDVARLVGNSPEVIYKHYAGNRRYSIKKP